MNKILKQLEGEINEELNYILTLRPGSDEHTAAVDNLSKLCKLRIEEIKAEQENKEKINRRKMEERLKLTEIEAESKRQNEDLQLKVDQARGNKIERISRIVLDLLAIFTPPIAYGIWMRRGLEFEKDGTFTSTIFRGLVNKRNPFNK